MFKPVIIAMILLFTCPAGAGQEALLLDRLRVDSESLRSAEQDFQRHQGRGNMGAAESRDYATYVDRLRQRVVRDCAALAAVEIAIPADLECPQQPFSSAGPAAIDQQAEQTDAERAAALDAELSTGLGTFDEKLLREQERVKAARQNTGGGGGQGGAGSTAEGGRSGGLAGSGDTNGAGESQQDGALSAPPSTSENAKSSGRQTAVKERPTESVDENDDVVARQLREAAEKEADPELRKKLWEEYRKYKQGTR
ncbi:MAG TPA: hypothetical protein ENI74_03240 [Gammaproteobacteria bacterium]|nr:hypothetical protein [Gammaproteobacteria bacterium]